MTSYAIISDVHANLEALQAVLKAIAEENVGKILFLGDSVGYGPNPNECIETLKEKADTILAGNHDWASVGMTDIAYFNPFARVALEWTHDVLTAENHDFLRNLPLTDAINGIFLVHASPDAPEKWHYVMYDDEVLMSFRYFQEKMCFVGHSHVPFIAEHSPRGKIIFSYDYAEIREQNRYIMNVGSVGQPRDGNPDAAYVLLKGNTVTIKRVSYDIVVTQKKMKKAGLPDYLINRLSEGR